jgi:hypothetical protein
MQNKLQFLRKKTITERERINEEIGNELGTPTSGLMPMMLIGVAKRFFFSMAL